MSTVGPETRREGGATTARPRARQIKALVVDDSAVVRQVMTAVLDDDPTITVTAAVPDPIFAMQRMMRDWPDVVVLDLEMPRMDGLTFLRRIMAARPTPVIICSTLTARGTSTAMEAMAAGAVAVIAKPTTGLRDFLQNEAQELVRAVHVAAAGDVDRVRATALAASTQAPRLGRTRTAQEVTSDRLVALGTSTGGTQALELVLRSLPPLPVGIVAVQHMPERFTAAFARRLDGLCALEVREAGDGDPVLPGRVLIAPGGRQMTVHRSGAQHVVRVSDGERVNRHKPSVDVLLGSVARALGPRALGVIMTGMGADGAHGLLAMRRAGARTIGQDERSCVVYGMPKAAYELGAVEKEVPLDTIATAIQAYATGASR